MGVWARVLPGHKGRFWCLAVNSSWCWRLSPLNFQKPAVFIRDTTYCTPACEHTHANVSCLLFLTRMRSQYKAVYDTVLGAGRAAHQRSQLLAVMCQHDSRPEIQAGSLSLSLRNPSLAPSCCGILFPFFFLIDPCFLFYLSIWERHGSQKRISSGGGLGLGGGGLGLGGGGLGVVFRRQSGVPCGSV